MYPSPRRTRSLPKRELQILRQLLGDAEDAVALVQAARPVAARVVVKRPHRAAPLLPDVSFEVSTKLVRFDVYVNPDRMEGGPS
jgi:16S rRNA (guanine1516-N2)-methyltransferase